MAQRPIVILDTTGPTLDVPQGTDTYLCETDLAVTGNISVTGTVDGRDVAADGALAASALQNVVEDLTPQLGGSLDVNGQKIVSAANGDIDIEPNGTGNVLLGNFAFNADATIGAGQDDYVITYDHATGLLNLEAAPTPAGVFLADGSVDMTGTFGTDTGVFRSDVANGATAVAFNLGSYTYTTAGAKLISIINNSDVAFSVDYSGVLRLENYSAGVCTIEPYNSTAAKRISFTGDTVRAAFGNGIGREILVGNTGQYQTVLSALCNSTGFKILADAQIADNAAAPLYLTAGAALPAAVTNLDGGNLLLAGGAGASSSAGDADGGHVYLDGGQGYGTGSHGDVIVGATRGNLVVGTTGHYVINEVFTSDVATVADGDYVLWYDAPWPGTVTMVRTDCASGTCTLTGKVNTTALGGTANSVSSTATEQTHSTSNTFVKGDKLQYTISANAACLTMAVAFYITRTG